MTDDMIKALHFDYAIELGKEVHDSISTGKSSSENLSKLDQLNLYSYQFSEYWLAQYEMKDIKFILQQFPWLSSGSGVV